MFGPYHREHVFRAGLAPSSELGISFCPHPTSLLAAKPARSLWNLATLRKQWKLGFVFPSLYHYSKGFLKPTHMRVCTYTLQLFFSPPTSLGLPGNFQSEKGPWVGDRDTPGSRLVCLPMGYSRSAMMTMIYQEHLRSSLW